MSKLLTPPHAHATTSAEFENASDNFDDASTMLDESGYIELNDDFIDEFHATSDAGAIRDLLARRAIRYKLSPDAKFAASPINISDKDYDFSLDLSVGTPNYPSRIPDMHTIHDPMISVS
jgi:hypothetical protein